MHATEGARVWDSELEQTLFQQAVVAYNNAHASYQMSYKVGAAILAKKAGGTFEIFTGSRIQGPYPSKVLCAEGGALSSAMAKGHTCFSALVIASNDGTDGLCKTCNEILYFTLSQKELAVFFINKDGQVVTREGNHPPH